MPPDPNGRTGAFARVIGPFVAIVAAIAAVGMPEISATPFLDGFFQNPPLVWITGATLVLFGLVILVQHPVWSSAPAGAISLLGWTRSCAASRFRQLRKPMSASRWRWRT